MTKAVELAQVASTGVSEAFKNRIINGAMVIAQRGTSAVTTSGSYPVDRFSAISNASDFTSIQNTTVPSGANFAYSVSIQPTSTKTPGAGTYAAITTNVEGLNMQGLGWGSSSALPITVSFWVRSSKTGTYSVSTKNANASRSWCQEYTISAANTWEFKSYTITGCPDGSWPIDNTRGMTFDFWLAGQNTQTSTIGSWISGNANMSTNQVNFFDNTSNVFYITGVQAEVGSTATSFETRSYGTELQLCQRYCPVISSTDRFGTVTAYASAFAFYSIRLTTPTRTPPTGVSVTGNYVMYTNGTAYTPSSLTFDGSGSNDYVTLSVNGSSLPTTGAFELRRASGTCQMILTGCEL